MKRSTKVLYLLIDKYRVINKTQAHSLLDHFVAKRFPVEYWNCNTLGDEKTVGEKILAGIHQRISKKERSNKRLLMWSSVAAVASSVLILLSIGLGLFEKNSDQQWLSYSTTSALDSLQLSDGSKIYLSPNSTFSYPKIFDGEQRLVKLLKGNAFFKVYRNPQKPFIVLSQGLQTKVLGTSFNISITDRESVVTVHTGKVRVSHHDQSVNLTPLERVTYFYESDQLNESIVSSSVLMEWYSEDIRIVQQPLAEVLHVIEKKFGVCFDVVDYDSNKRLTMRISKDATLQDVIDQINYITSLNINANEAIATNQLSKRN